MDESIVSLVRSIIAFSTLLLFTRLLGKRQVGQLSAFEYIAGITIGSIASSLSVDTSTKPLPQFIGLITWIALVFLLEIISIKYRWFGKVISDQPIIVVQDGKILEQNLRSIRYRYDSLLGQLRENNVFDITHVKYALIEPSGKLTVLKKPEFEQLTPNDIKLQPSNNGLMTEVIIDGVIIKENLASRNKDELWLTQQLQAQGASNINEVSFAAILPNGQLYVDMHKDRIKNVDIGDFDGPF